ncbi:polysaccharide deacetylase family protein [Paenibacillus eucommiae]|uniref:Peptidoglycan/xylan/chitin deacetylase (PgdA/CDA1 family) n=1 Tax=Paenibacillus eucommiae TaxID=1355755 RepID=A0ABS4IYT4_9BACL|nr:polysaccharide deacetylase family protein [Paenibacillus eucommiae]MBP1992752.1 peptidoglycan/xylan/chitin deacetylase (PgdA/CDA1 family) [Paenibacillus eucommiae]
MRGVILSFLTMYMFIPWVLTRMLGLGVFHKGKTQREVAFTFDDGPDPRYTPTLLDILNKHNVKATFFVLGSKAEKYPEIIQRIHQEGHQIGIHNYYHHSNWLMTPWGVRQGQVNRSADTIEAITGTRPAYYRPPWGILSLGDFFLKKDFVLVLWSLMAWDWNSRVSSKRLRKKLSTITDGSIILLHDSGETLGADENAPELMLRALDEVLLDLNNRKFKCVRIDEMMENSKKPKKGERALGMSRFKQLLVASWMLWERCFVKLFHLMPVDTENPLLKLRIKAYTGNQSITLEDGEVIAKGDLIAELHFDNKLLLKLSNNSPSSVHLAIQIIRKTEQLMPLIRWLLQNDPNYKDVKGLYGITLIHRGARKLGFSIIDLPRGIFSYLTQSYLRLLLSVLHPQGKKRLKLKTERLVPKIIAISRKELMNRYIA